MNLKKFDNFVNESNRKLDYLFDEVNKPFCKMETELPRTDLHFLF